MEAPSQVLQPQTKADIQNLLLSVGDVRPADITVAAVHGVCEIALSRDLNCS